MTWEKISNQHSSLQEYRFTDSKNGKLVLKYNPLHQSARITFENNHRLFYLESAGSLSGKTLLKNEYGMETGHIAYQRAYQNEGDLVIDNKKFYYKLDNDRLVVYNKDVRQPLASCRLQNTQDLSSNTGVDVICYVLGMCWYLFLHSANSLSVEYAAAV